MAIGHFLLLPSDSIGTGRISIVLAGIGVKDNRPDCAGTSEYMLDGATLAVGANNRDSNTGFS